jgi:hypothetical protein
MVMELVRLADFYGIGRKPKSSHTKLRSREKGSWAYHGSANGQGLLIEISFSNFSSNFGFANQSQGSGATGDIATDTLTFAGATLKNQQFDIAYRDSTIALSIPGPGYAAGENQVFGNPIDRYVLLSTYLSIWFHPSLCHGRLLINRIMCCTTLCSSLYTLHIRPSLATFQTSLPTPLVT